jgi:hypothetical protein
VQLKIDHVYEHRKLVFVAHSMGGIIARKLVTEDQTELMAQGIAVGLFLIASPSRGAKLADWLQLLARLLSHSQADALRCIDNNPWLKDLDRVFLNCKEIGHVHIRGQELVEDRFIILGKVISSPIVPEESAARYFGNPVKIPDSDHFSIAKPSSKDSLQHRMLHDFLVRFIADKAALPYLNPRAPVGISREELFSAIASLQSRSRRRPTRRSERSGVRWRARGGLPPIQRDTSTTGFATSTTLSCRRSPRGTRTLCFSFRSHRMRPGNTAWLFLICTRTSIDSSQPCASRARVVRDCDRAEQTNRHLVGGGI